MSIGSALANLPPALMRINATLEPALFSPTSPSLFELCLGLFFHTHIRHVVCSYEFYCHFLPRCSFSCVCASRVQKSLSIDHALLGLSFVRFQICFQRSWNLE